MIYSQKQRLWLEQLLRNRFPWYSSCSIVGYHGNIITTVLFPWRRQLLYNYYTFHGNDNQRIEMIAVENNFTQITISKICIIHFCTVNVPLISKQNLVNFLIPLRVLVSMSLLLVIASSFWTVTRTSYVLSPSGDIVCEISARSAVSLIQSRDPCLRYSIQTDVILLHPEYGFCVSNYTILITMLIEYEIRDDTLT
jgi:hypothetical protein